jgi:lipoprotein NlpI
MLCGAANTAVGDTFTGTGVVIGSRGEILTNSHVVAACESITVRPLSERPETATLIARDEHNDLAVIRTKESLRAVATFREGAPTRAGDAVVVLGYPLSGLLAATANLTVGNVSALAGLGNDSRYLQISAPVQPGNSGGPLLDASGHLIGIVTSKLNAASVARVTGDIPQNVNFALKAEVARTFLDSEGIAYRVESSPRRGFWDFGKQTAKAVQQLSAADVGDIAKPFTVYIECERVRAPPDAAPAPEARAQRTPAAVAPTPAPEAGAPRPASADEGQVCRQQTGDDAIAACTHIIASGNRESSTLAWAFGNRGRAYGSKGDYDRAIKDLDQALTLDPKIRGVYVNRGLAYEGRGDHDRAIKDYDQAIKLDPNDVTAFNNRGIAYGNKGDYDRAIADFDEATALDPKYVNAFNNRGVAYKAKDDLDHAIADYSEAIKLDPKYPKAFNNRGVAYKAKGDNDRAIKEFDQAIMLDPKFAIAFLNRGNSYRLMGDYDLAIADYSEALRLNPKTSDSYANRGFTYFLKADFAVAAADLERLIQLKEGPYPMLWRYLARGRAGNVRGAEELATNAARLKTKEWPYPVIEFYLGKRLAAEMLTAAAKPEERCEAQFYLGEWYLLHKNHVKAAGALRTAADTCPKNNEYDGALAELKRLN